MPSLRQQFFNWLARQLVKPLHKTPYVHGQHAVVVGRNVSLSDAILNARSGRIVIGNDVIFGHGVMVLTGVHEVETVDGPRPTLTDAERDVVIEDSAWIASGAILVGPVRVGRGSVVGAGSVVTKDVPPGVLAAGNPARVIRPLRAGEAPEAPA